LIGQYFVAIRQPAYDAAAEYDGITVLLKGPPRTNKVTLIGHRCPGVPAVRRYGLRSDSGVGVMEAAEIRDEQHERAADAVCGGEQNIHLTVGLGIKMALPDIRWLGEEGALAGHGVIHAHVGPPLRSLAPVDVAAVENDETATRCHGLVPAEEAVGRALRKEGRQVLV
jgi:hypothetical protein